MQGVCFEERERDRAPVVGFEAEQRRDITQHLPAVRQGVAVRVARVDRHRIAGGRSDEWTGAQLCFQLVAQIVVVGVLRHVVDQQRCRPWARVGGRVPDYDQRVLVRGGRTESWSNGGAGRHRVGVGVRRVAVSDHVAVLDQQKPERLVHRNRARQQPTGARDLNLVVRRPVDVGPDLPTGENQRGVVHERRLKDIEDLHGRQNRRGVGRVHDDSHLLVALRRVIHA